MRKPGISISRTLGDTYAHTLGLTNKIGNLKRYMLDIKTRCNIFNYFRIRWIS